VTAAEATDAAELALVRRAQAGDHDAFGELVERHRRAVFRAVVAALGSQMDADDVAQEAFVIAFRKIGGFRGEAQFRTWLLTIAWRRALDRRRSVARWARRLVPSAPSRDDGMGDLIDHAPAAGSSPEERLLAAERHRRIRQLVARLPKKLRETLLLAGSGDYAYDEIAAMLQVPIGTIKWRVSEARRLLRVKLAALEDRHD
jgi:RNA polymerase sigma-70 factor (ECF subfamily)